MAARGLALLLLLVAPLASCKTWPSRPLDAATTDAAGVDAGADAATDAGEDAIERDATDGLPAEDGAAVQEAGGSSDRATPAEGGSPSEG
jgi:hypothetical protein